MSITAAIVTARQTQDTTFAAWCKLREALFNQCPVTLAETTYADFESSALTMEFRELLLACLPAAASQEHHLVPSLRSLRLQTKLPDEILIIDRLFDLTSDQEKAAIVASLQFPNTTKIQWLPPILSQEENAYREAAGIPFSWDWNGKAFCCADKNTAVVKCQTDHLIMVDDCCLASPGLVYTANEVCNADKILLLGHAKVFLPNKDNPKVDFTVAHWLQSRGYDETEHKNILRPVFGVWAMPLKFVLAVNGFNTKVVDTALCASDVELFARMGRYTDENKIKYVMRSSARLYEVEHAALWPSGDSYKTLKQFLQPEGYRVLGPDLTALHNAV